MSKPMERSTFKASFFADFLEQGSMIEWLF
jgi:hypothetical protein